MLRQPYEAVLHDCYALQSLILSLIGLATISIPLAISFGIKQATYALGTGSLYLHYVPLSLYALQGFVSSHFLLSWRHCSQAFEAKG